jgi:oligopeptidase B
MHARPPDLLVLVRLRCSATDDPVQILPEPPQAPRDPVDVSIHGDVRIDEYHWLRDRDDPRTLESLKAENAYARAWFDQRAPLCESLYQEMLARIQEDDEAVPYRFGRWWYSTRTIKGAQYPLHIRRAADGERRFDPQAREEVLLDLNVLAEGKAFLSLGTKTVSPDGAMLAYSLDETGGRDYTLHVKDLSTGDVLPLAIADVDSAAWGNDNRTLYYVTVDEAKRAHRLWRHVLGGGMPDELLYEEADELFSIHVGKTRDQRYVLVGADSMDTSEVRLIDASLPSAAPRVLFERRTGIEYDVDHREGRFYLRVNDTGRNFRLMRVDAAAPDLARAEELVPARDDVMLEDVDVFARHMVVTERVAGNLQLRVWDLETGEDHAIAFDEAAYTVGGTSNIEFDTHTYRFAYTSLATPHSVYDYDMTTRERVLRKRQPVLGGYDPAAYATERLMARAADGTDVPVSLVYRRDRRGPAAAPQPLLLEGYGSYGIPSDPYFSSARVSLLDRGVIYAIAHVRGGGDLGRTWYEAGKMANKMNTFTDFIACAHALVERGYTEPSKLAIEGGSAGGLLMGGVVNLRRDLFKAVVAHVPFVDVINTMLDETIPLTTGEFIEWGNPKVAEQYAWMRAYSPYDNLQPGAYPAMFVRTGINDSQVAYWEPAKYVARLRTLKIDSNPLLFLVNLEVGHGGSSGRYDALRETAEDFVFILEQLGVTAAPSAAR